MKTTPLQKFLMMMALSIITMPIVAACIFAMIKGMSGWLAYDVPLFLLWWVALFTATCISFFYITCLQVVFKKRSKKKA